MPEINGETNCKELFKSIVLEANEKTMVLNVNNVAVLFEAIDEKNIKKLNKTGNIEYTTGEIHSFVGTVLEETITYMVVEPNEENNRNPENVIIKVDSTTISPKSISIIITDNNTEHYGWGVEFRVQQKVNEEWEELKISVF